MTDFLVVSHVQPDGDAVSSTSRRRLASSATWENSSRMINEGASALEIRFIWKLLVSITNYSEQPPTEIV